MIPRKEDKKFLEKNNLIARSAAPVEDKTAVRNEKNDVQNT